MMPRSRKTLRRARGTLPLKPAKDCAFRVVALGEPVVRFSPELGIMLQFANRLDVSMGGTDVNVVHALDRLGIAEVALLSALPAKSALTERILRDLNASNISLRFMRDGSPSDLPAMCFAEAGAGARGGQAVVIRQNTSASKLKPNDFPLGALFGSGVQVFHTGSIFAGLSASTLALTHQAVEAARRAGTLVSWDTNYRPSLHGESPKSRGASGKSWLELNRQFLSKVDIVAGNEGLLELLMGVPFDQLWPLAVEKWPNLRVVAATHRQEIAATEHDWSARMWYDGGMYRSQEFKAFQVVDRVGSGDGLVAGLLAGLLEGEAPEAALNLGVAVGAHVMTTRGDMFMGTKEDALRLLSRNTSMRR